MMTFCALDNMSDATQHHGLGWGGMMTFCALDNMSDATQHHGLGWGGVKFFHIERKITSVVHSHPPSHYIRKHAPG